MYRKTIVYASLLMVIVLAGVIVGMNLFRAPGESEKGPSKESQQSSEEKAAETVQSNQTTVLLTLENYDWNEGVPSWEVLNRTAENLTRIEIDFLTVSYTHLTLPTKA